MQLSRLRYYDWTFNWEIICVIVQIDMSELVKIILFSISIIKPIFIKLNNDNLKKAILLHYKKF